MSLTLKKFYENRERFRRVYNSRWLVIQDAQGRYLHLSGEGWTNDRNYAWCGTEGQLAAIRDTSDALRSGVKIFAVDVTDEKRGGNKWPSVPYQLNEEEA